MHLPRFSFSLASIALLVWGCRDPSPTPPPPNPSSTASVAPSASAVPSASAAASAVPENDSPEPIGGIVRSPLGPDAPTQCPASGEFPQVIAREGKIVLCTGVGTEEMLTTGGKDGVPSLSPNRTSLLFLREFGDMKVSLGGGDFVSVQDNRVMVMNLKDRQAQDVGRPSEDAACLSLSSPRWLDDTAIFVQSNGYGMATIHNLSLCLVDVRTRKIFNIARRTSCAIPITVGKYKGQLFVAPWNFRTGVGLSEWYGVVDRQGRKLRSFEDNPFVRDWNGDGFIQNEETSPECMDMRDHRAEVEKIMTAW